MLQSIREHTQGWIAGTIVSMIILTFALWGIHSYFTTSTNHSIVAVVNGLDITKDQLTTAYDRLRRQAQAQYGITGTGQEELVLKHQALQGLITVSALKQASFKQGFRITDEQIDRYLESMPEFQVDGQFSMERFQQTIATTAMSISEFLELVRTSLLIDQPRLGIILTSFAIPEETQHTISLVNEERDVSYLLIPLSGFLSQSINISPEQIKAYYQQHRNDFMTPEQVNVSYVSLSIDQLKTAFHPTEAELRRLYNDNVSAYTNPTRWQLSALTIPLPPHASNEEVTLAQQKAAHLAALPNKTSFRPIGKGWLTLDQVPAALEQVVAGMTAKGQLSDPVQTPTGLVVVQVTDYEAPKVQPFEAVQDKVKLAYIRQHAEEKFSTVRDQLADLTYEHPDSLVPAATALHLPVLTSELFVLDKPGKGIAQYKKIRDVAFSNDVLNVQNNSDVIPISPETVIVLRVNSHIPSTLLQLKDVANQIKDKLTAEETERRASNLADELLTQLKQGTSPEKLATAHQLTWVKAGWMGRYATAVDPAILDSVFRLPDPIKNHKPAIYGSVHLPHSYAIVALHGVHAGVVKNPEQNKVFAEQVEQSEGALEYELYKQSQIGNAKIVIRQQ